MGAMTAPEPQTAPGPMTGGLMGMVRDAIPAHVRIFASTLLGDRSPITERNFSPAELQQLGALVSKDEAVLPARAHDNAALADRLQRELPAKEQALARAKADPAVAAQLAKQEGSWSTDDFLSDAAREIDGDKRRIELAKSREQRAQSGQGAVTYTGDRYSASGYPRNARQQGPLKVGPLAAGINFGDRNLDAIGNTLGQFTYAGQPNGSAVINDNYDWDSGGSRNHRADGPVDFAKRLMSGDLEVIPATLMPTAQSGRPVRIALPPRPRMTQR